MLIGAKWEGGGSGVDEVEVVVGRGGGGIDDDDDGGGGGSDGVMSWQCDDAATCFVIMPWEWYVSAITWE